MTYLWLVLGSECGEWRNWVEGVFLTEQGAIEARVQLEGEDEGYSSYFIEMITVPDASR